jgi:hypothetical protein
MKSPSNSLTWTVLDWEEMCLIDYLLKDLSTPISLVGVVGLSKEENLPLEAVFDFLS